MKIKLLFSGFLFCLISWGQVPTNGLVKEYDFTFGTNNQYLTSNVQSNLQSGVVNLSRTGLNGSVTTDRLGESQRAVVLNGDYYQSGGTEQQFVNAYTISFWMKSSTVDTNSRRIIDQKGSSPSHGFNVILFNGKIRFFQDFGYGNTSITDVGTVFNATANTVADGSWHHVVCTVNSTATSVVLSPYVAWTINYYSKVYIDNVLVGTANQTVTPSYTSGQLVREAINRFQPLYFGSYPGNTTATNKYTDYLDQVKYYERELNDSEISELFYEGHPQQPIYVNANATGNNDGTSWANAYTNLQTAIDNNFYKDDIWVAAGIYTPTSGGRNSTFLISDRMNMYGGFNGTESTLEQRDFRANVTVLNGDVNGNDNSNVNPTEPSRADNLYHILTLKGQISNAIIDGFTFSGANANGTSVTSGTPSAQYLNNRGGAVFVHTYVSNENIKATFSNCTFDENTATDTAVYANWFSTGVSQMNHDVNFESCIFKNNFSTQNAQVLFLGSNGFGQTHIGKVINCLFYNNTSINGPAAIYFFTSTANGGNSLGVVVEVINSTFSSNNGNFGNTIRFDNSPRVTMINSIVYGNGSTTPLSGSSYYTTVNSIVQGGQMGGSDTDPLLDIEFKLTASSPAINSGNDALVPGNILVDLAGNNRFVGTIDKGAYEYDASLESNEFQSFSDFFIYPNPTYGTIYIQSQEVIKRVELYSIDGRKLLETKNSVIQIDDLPSGIYLVSIEAENNTKGSQKIIKQ
ncbi:T9SS type A sorting domain-containing protein [Flavobacterium sp. TP390]|uniref:T9SS type A sorting domain-containing protein n=1 Tax=Flavobacterium profundi TaxID=1774945 RepID=A0A6I4IJB0_9FLAO|nr:T9SS type A sorting domain-containing protein [Flavobacterium profundi]MVO09840.1 T9SS type A sorting domain-containing protein [Flavobacterium profundi]